MNLGADAGFMTAAVRNEKNKMKNTPPTIQTILFGLLVGLFISACGVVLFDSAENVSSTLETSDIERHAVNGERIYFTGTNMEGERIDFEEGPNFGGMMMGTYLTCASCHGPEGRGGYHIMHMTPMDAPDIRYSTLVEEGKEHTESEGEHGDEHSDYDLKAFRLAVIEGKHSNGKPLSRLMPRWNLSERDLADLFKFLKTIP